MANLTLYDYLPDPTDDDDSAVGSNAAAAPSSSSTRASRAWAPSRRKKANRKANVIMVTSQQHVPMGEGTRVKSTRKLMGSKAEVKATLDAWVVEEMNEIRAKTYNFHDKESAEGIENHCRFLMLKYGNSLGSYLHAVGCNPETCANNCNGNRHTGDGIATKYPHRLRLFVEGFEDITAVFSSSDDMTAPGAFAAAESFSEQYAEAELQRKIDREQKKARNRGDSEWESAGPSEAGQASLRAHFTNNLMCPFKKYTALLRKDEDDPTQWACLPAEPEEEEEDDAPPSQRRRLNGDGNSIDATASA
jgi:hypothetical protein